MAFLVNNVSVGSGCCQLNAFTEATWATNQPGYQPPSFYDLILISASTPVSLFGLSLDSGRVIRLRNVGTFPITFVQESSSATTTAMRLDNPQQTTFVLEYGHTVTYRAEDPTLSTSRVRLIDSTFSFFPGTTGGSTITGGKNTNEGLIAIPTSANPPGTATYDILLNTQDTTLLRTLLRLRNLTTGTPAPGIGTSISFTLNSLTPAEITAGLIDLVTTAMTLGAEAADLAFWALRAGTLTQLARLANTTGLELLKAAGAPATPPAGYGTLYFDATTGKPAAIDSGANVYDLSRGPTEGTVAAAGASQGTAAAMTATAVKVTGASGSNGVILPNVAAAVMIVWNSDSLNSVNVYPPSGANINTGAANAALVLGAKLSNAFFRVTATQWFAVASGNSP